MCKKFNNGMMELDIDVIVRDLVDMGIYDKKDIEAFGFTEEEAKEIRKRMFQ